jgi:hypothetical protein
VFTAAKRAGRLIGAMAYADHLFIRLSCSLSLSHSHTHTHTHTPTHTTHTHVVVFLDAGTDPTQTEHGDVVHGVCVLFRHFNDAGPNHVKISFLTSCLCVVWFQLSSFPLPTITLLRTSWEMTAQPMLES